MNELNSRSLGTVAGKLFESDRSFRGTLQKLRPYICPFEEIIPHIPANATVLDIGCGNGLFLGLLSTQSKISSGTGIDLSHAVIDSARNLAERMNGSANGAQLTFRQAATLDDWPDEHFDVVSMIDVVHHVEPASQEEFVRAAMSKVKPDGSFIYKDMANRPVWMAMANRMHDLLLARQWINYMPIERVDVIAKEEGFAPRIRKSLNRLCYAHELRVFAKKMSLAHTANIMGNLPLGLSVLTLA